MMQINRLRFAVPLMGAALAGCQLLGGSKAAPDSKAVLQYALPKTVFQVMVVEETPPKPALDPAPAGASLAPAGPAAEPPLPVDAKNAQHLADLTHGAHATVAGHGALGAPSLPVAAPASPVATAVPPTPSKASYALYIVSRDIADSAAFYTVRYSPSILADDKFDLTVSDQGFLDGLNAKPSDQSVKFIAKIGELGVNIAEAVPGFASAANFKQAPESQTLLLSIDVDPADATPGVRQRTIAALDLLEQKYHYRIEFDQPSPPLPAPAPSRSGAGPCDIGLCFRTKAPVKMRVFQHGDDGWLLVNEENVEIPNFSSVFAVPVTRAFGVEKDTLLTINKGYLSKYDLTKPSEVIAPIQAAIDLTKSVAGIPAAVFGLDKGKLGNQTDLIAAQGKVVDAQKDLYTSQAALIDAQTALAAKKAAAEPSVPKTPTAPSPPP